jgi:hypothetical protein
MKQNPDLSLVYTGINVIAINDFGSTYIEPCFRGIVTSSILRYPSRAIVLLGASTALLKTSYIKEENLTWNESLRLPGEDINFFNKVALMSHIDFINKPLVNYRQHISSRSKMRSSDFIQGNREAFIDFACFARKYISYKKLSLSWIRLNLIFTKHAFLNKEYLTTLRQVKYFLHLIPIRDRNKSRDRVIN